MERSIPVKDEIWQHFKGHLYKVCCVTRPVTEAFHWGMLPVGGWTAVRHTESEERIKIWHENGSWVHCAADDPTPLVLYSLTENRQGTILSLLIWARPISSFMAADDRSETGWKFWRLETQQDSQAS